jgi:DNA-binding response OmpR family regulator
MITEKILVVDDEKTVCDSIKKILTRRGYEVENSLDADEAIKKIKETSYDLVITDLMMPKTNGIELLQIIKQHYPELEVVLITGYASIDTAVKATKLGAADYLPKPFTPDELTTITRKALEKSKTRQVERKTDSSKKVNNLPKVEPGDANDEKIDVDMPFSEREIELATSKEFVEKLTRSDIPQIKKARKKTEYCELGKRECRRLVLEGRECVGECPIDKKAREKAAKAGKKIHTFSKDIIDVDMPFNMSEVEEITSFDYINCLDRSDIPRAALYGSDATSKHNVLVVDDEPIVCHSLRRILSKQSCAVEEAFDVDAALQKMKLNKYDLIFLDLKMPKRNGMEVLESIKRLYPNIPVVMITGYASIETAVEATQKGAFDFIPKPFTPEELKSVAVEAFAS